METHFDGILFAEYDLPQAIILSKITVNIDDKLGVGSQLKNLDDVKRELAQRVKRLGGNALVRFEYGQKHVSFWRSLLSLDEIAWYGSGFVAKLK
jgi:hypothetical protein